MKFAGRASIWSDFVLRLLGMDYDMRLASCGGFGDWRRGFGQRGELSPNKSGCPRGGEGYPQKVCGFVAMLGIDEGVLG